MQQNHAGALALELSNHRYWRVDGVSPALPSVKPGPAEGHWIRLRHRTSPNFRYLIAVEPDPRELAIALNHWGRHIAAFFGPDDPGMLHWYWEGEFATH